MYVTITHYDSNAEDYVTTDCYIEEGDYIKLLSVERTKLPLLLEVMVGDGDYKAIHIGEIACIDILKGEIK